MAPFVFPLSVVALSLCCSFVSKHDAASSSASLGRLLPSIPNSMLEQETAVLPPVSQWKGTPCRNPGVKATHPSLLLSLALPGARRSLLPEKGRWKSWVKTSWGQTRKVYRWEPRGLETPGEKHFVAPALTGLSYSLPFVLTDLGIRQQGRTLSFGCCACF